MLRNKKGTLQMFFKVLKGFLVDHVYEKHVENGIGTFLYSL